jgi:hypothetical protein
MLTGFSDLSKELKKLGKYKAGKSCLNIKNLEEIDLAVLKKMIKSSVKEMNKIYKVS